MIAGDVVDGTDLDGAFDEVFGDREIRVCLVDDIAGNDDYVRVSFFDLLEQKGLLDAEELVVKVGDLNDGDFGGEPQVDFVIGRDEVVVLIEAETADDYLGDHEDWNDEELCLQRFVMEETHA